MKYADDLLQKGDKASLPPRGAWIEIIVFLLVILPSLSLPHGERGLKLLWEPKLHHGSRRSPHGERGLKCHEKTHCKSTHKSLPPRGAWIEIRIQPSDREGTLVAPPTGSVD